MHIAEINIARLTYPADDVRVAPFISAVERVNAIADRSPGFVWRFAGDDGNALATRISDDPNVIVNVSVWESVAALENYVFNTVHRQFYARRGEWFDILGAMHFAMWRVEPGTRPRPHEAMARLAHFRTHGDSDVAFGWTHVADAVRWRSAQCGQIAAE